MTASPPPPVPPLVQALRDVREILERARGTGDRQEIEEGIDRINAELDRSKWPSYGERFQTPSWRQRVASLRSLVLPGAVTRSS